MEEMLVQGTVSIAQNTSFITRIPTEAWFGFVGVIVGAVIPSLTTIITVISNNKSNKVLKEIEISTQLKSQQNTEIHAKKMRLLDERLKAFAEFSLKYNRIFHGSDEKEIIKRCEDLLLAIAALEVVAPELMKDCMQLTSAIVRYSNYMLDVLQGKKFSIRTANSHMNKIRPIGMKIRKSLPEIL
jgi:hypothetical protein